MPLNNADIQTQLMGLRDLSNRFEVLAELQTAQLKLWPLAVNPNLIDSRAEVDFTHNKIYFYWTLPKKQKVIKNYQERLDSLGKAVKWLLGDEWETEIHNLNTKETIFSSVDVSASKPGPGTRPSSRRRGRVGRRLANRQRKASSK